MHSHDAKPGEVWTDERCFIRELINDPAQPAASLARCRVTRGTLTQKHALSVAEWYVVLSGSGTMHVGDAPPFAIAAGDVVTIPPNTSQQVRNSGDSDLEFECLCIPRFTADCYRSLEA